MNVSESGISFEIPDRYAVSKFDDTAFYRECANKLPGLKAVDYVIAIENRFLLIEVKNCKGHEAQNRWRIAPDNKKRDSIPTDHDIADRDSLDIEAANKAKDTLATLVGVWSHPEFEQKVSQCLPVAEKLMDGGIHSGKRKIDLVVLLEGDFDARTRNNNMIRKALQDSARHKMKWLNCTVLFTTTQEFSEKYGRFGISATIL